jgi:hypothetical protein
MSVERAAAGLAEVRAELQAWRGQRRKGDRIPEKLWRRATQAVRQYGVNPVSRALRLDYYELKRRTGNGERQVTRKHGPVFVEMSAGLGAEALGQEVGLACVVELEKGNGTRMRICVRDAVGVDWGEMKEAFLGA